jgi:hypothetical protein
MRLYRNAVFTASLLGVLMSFSGSASALTQRQWNNVCVNFLGLRSAAHQNDTNGAGYGMDDGNTVPMNCIRNPPPTHWDVLLAGTIEQIKAFPNSGTQYLLIVNHCPGQARDYPSTFPKCNRVMGGVIHATPATLSHYSDQQLITWVEESIPQQ